MCYPLQVAVHWRWPPLRHWQQYRCTSLHPVLSHSESGGSRLASPSIYTHKRTTIRNNKNKIIIIRLCSDKVWYFNNVTLIQEECHVERRHKSEDQVCTKTCFIVFSMLRLTCHWAVDPALCSTPQQAWGLPWPHSKTGLTLLSSRTHLQASAPTLAWLGREREARGSQRSHSPLMSSPSDNTNVHGNDGAILWI